MSVNNACIYKLTFLNRIEAETPPYYYIGSKTNYSYVNGVILDKTGKPYFGSSKWKSYKDIVANSKIKTEILKEFFNIKTKDLMIEEGIFQRSVKAKTSVEYFNLEYADSSKNNNYTNPDYATYKHHLTGKTIRLLRTAPEVLSGEFVGVTKNRKMSTEEKRRRSESNKGEKNGFYGKKHKQSSKDAVSIANSGRKRTAESRRKQSEKIKGIPKNEAHKSKIGRKGLVNLKHLDGRSVRVPKAEEAKYKSEGFMNPFALVCLKKKMLLSSNDIMNP